MSYADLTVQDKSVSFLHDRLFKLEYAMHHNGYSCADSACCKLGLREALVAKFGQPSLIQKEQLQKQAGSAIHRRNPYLEKWGFHHSPEGICWRSRLVGSLFFSG